MKPKFATRLFVWAGVGCVLMAAPRLRAQNYRLYVDNSTDKTVSVIDLNSLKVVSDIDLGADLIHGLALAHDGKLLFVTVESDHTLRIVDTTTGQTTATVKLTGRPNECAVTPDGKISVAGGENGTLTILRDLTTPVSKFAPPKR